MAKNGKIDEVGIVDLKGNGSVPTGKIDPLRPRSEASSFGGMTKDELMNALRLMILSRTIDHKVMTLIKQGKAFFLISGAGHEATQAAFGLAMKKGVDWAYPYYRDMCFSSTLGSKPEDLFLAIHAKRNDPLTGGRQMPCHWSSKEFNIPTQSSPTGTQFLQAVGTALALKKKGINGVVYVSAGEGTTSQGEFHEAVNWAARE